MHAWQAKVCKTCSHWSEATKGLCTLTERACGQFYRCDSWKALHPSAQEQQALRKAS